MQQIINISEENKEKLEKQYGSLENALTIFADFPDVNRNDIIRKQTQLFEQGYYDSGLGSNLKGEIRKLISGENPYEIINQLIDRIEQDLKTKLYLAYPRRL